MSSRSSKRLKLFWKNVKKQRKLCKNFISSIDKLENDIRPFIPITIFDMTLLALLDSGANISCISGSAAKQFLNKNISYKKLNESVETASGRKFPIIGSVSTNISFQNTSKMIELFIIPDLQQDVYLGADFFLKFSLMKKLIESFSLEQDSTVKTPNMHSLNFKDQNQLDHIISMFPSFEQNGLGKTHLLQHKIEIEPNSRPIKQRYFSVSPAIEQKLHDEIDRMLKLGVIEPAPQSCSWSSPVTLVEKEGKLRLCLDSRKVNDITIKDAFPLPKINGILSRLPKAQFISSLDLKHAFWQIALSDDSRDYTAFTVANRPLYRFCVMPFGLCNAPMTMSRLMDMIISPELKNRVFVYLDDLLLVSESFESHLQLLLEVAQLLKKANLTVNISKCYFCMKELRYLGYVIGNGVIRVDMDKVSAISDLKPPTTQRELRRFLGLTGWYRRFIPNYAEIAVPLTDLTSKSKVFAWNENAQLAFDILKQKLTSAPLLITPNFDREFIIQCDASNFGVGGVLAQEDDDQVEKPIAYFSHKLNRAQKNYSITELECLAAVLCVKKFREYVEGYKFRIVTDHASLRWLMRQADLNGRLARWSLALQCFTFVIEHRRGTLNVVPDALSRLEAITYSNLDNTPLIDLKSPHFNSEQYQNLRMQIAKNLSRTPDLKIIDNYIYKRTQFYDGTLDSEESSWKLWVPNQLISDVIRSAHSPTLASHGGISKTLDRIRRNLFWPKMCLDVKNFIAQCDICKQSKSPNLPLRPLMGSMTKTSRPFEKLYLDFIGPYPRSKLGNTGVLVALDHLSKFPFLKAMRKCTAIEVCNYLEEYVFTVFGVPKAVITDNGSQFKSTHFNQFLAKYGVSHIYTSIYSPQTNASERLNRSIITAIRSYLDSDQRHWDNNLSHIAAALRCSHHSSIGYSPYFVAFGQQMILHGDNYEILKNLQELEEGESILRSDKLQLIRTEVRNSLRQAYDNNRKRYNLRSRSVKFIPGQTVFRRNFVQSSKLKRFNAKLAPKFIKSRVVRKVADCSYELEDIATKNLIKMHAKDIRT